MMQNMKSSNPDLPMTEIAKKLGKMWQKMSSNILDHCPLYYPSKSISIVSSVWPILQCFVIMFHHADSKEGVSFLYRTSAGQKIVRV
jgi:hypothetical protein